MRKATWMISTATLIAVAGIARGEDGLSFSKARIYIEFNASAQDVGIQVLLAVSPGSGRGFSTRGRSRSWTSWPAGT